MQLAELLIIYRNETRRDFGYLESAMGTASCTSTNVGTVICTSLPLLSSFPCGYPPTKIPVFGVAFAALEKLHLGSNFVLRDRGLLNLERQRSEQFPAPSPTRSLWSTLSQGPRTTGPFREYDNAKSAKLQLQCHLRHRHYSPCFSQFR